MVGMLKNASSLGPLLSGSVSLSARALKSLQNYGKIKIRAPVTGCKGLCLCFHLLSHPAKLSLHVCTKKPHTIFTHPAPVLALTMTCSSLEHPFSNQNLCSSETLLKTLFLYKVFQMHCARFSLFLKIFCYTHFTFKDGRGTELI